MSQAAALDAFVHVYRPGTNGRTLLLLHGTGGDETSLLRFAPVLDTEANILSVRGRVLENGYPRFFRRFAEGVFDLEDLQEQAHALAGFLLAAYETHGIDPKRVTAFGYSNGANIASALWLLHPESLANGVLVRPMFPIEPNVAPDLQGKRALLLAGQHDTISPIPTAEELERKLKAFGCQVELVRQPAGHELIEADLQLAQDFIATT